MARLLTGAANGQRNSQQLYGNRLAFGAPAPAQQQQCGMAQPADVFSTGWLWLTISTGFQQAGTSSALAVLYFMKQQWL
jgi:hypothetical protein